MALTIERAVLDDALLSFARSGHGLVLGRAGVGKSFSLAQLARRLESTNAAHLVVAVENLGEATEEETRIALGYPDASFTQAIQALFSSAGEGVLIFDGFDAARNEPARSRVIGMIRSALTCAPAGWTIVTSVRDYDARKSPTLTQLFHRTAGAVSRRFQMSGVLARHFAIPELDDEEVSSALQQVPGLAAIHRQASEGFRRLTRIPFNLWLLERILGQDGSPERVGALQSEVQLLDLYWCTTISDQPDGEQRTQILRSAVSQMIAARSLSFPKATVFSSDLSAPWNGLFSSGVLVEGGPGRQAGHFSHNILFDYAVSILAIPSSTADLARFLLEDVSRPLFLRPSLVYYFLHLWHASPVQFWQTFWSLLAAEQVPVKLVSRLLPAYIISTEARTLADLEPLIGRCRESHEDGPQAVLRVLQALRVNETADIALWVAFSVQLASIPSGRFAWELATFLRRVLDDPAHGSVPGIRSQIGDASRRLFHWVWERRRGPQQQWCDTFGPSVVLPLVLKTADTDIAGTATIIRSALSLLEEPRFPTRYLGVLSEEVVTFVAPHDPGVVADVYRAIFSHDEEKETDEPTAMGGIVLRLTSTRRQDFAMCTYALARDFSAYLKAAPEVGLATGFELLNLYSSKRSREDNVSSPRSFQFHGQECFYEPDGSAVWSSFLSHEEENTIASALRDFLESEVLAADSAVRVAGSKARRAWTWSLLLQAGAQAPERFATVLFELCLATPLQLETDTLQSLAAFVEAAASYWSPRDLETFQKRALALKDSTEAKPRHSQHVSDLLLSRLPPHLLTVEDARQRIESLAKSGSVPTNEPLVSYSRSVGRVTPESWLSDEGVELSLPANASLLSLATPMRAFSDAWTNKVPSPEAVEAFLPEIAAAADEIRKVPLPTHQPYEPTAPDAQPAPKTIEYAWTHLSAAAYALARTPLSPSDKAFEVARSVLMHAASFPPPPFDSERDRDYSTPSWSPNPRTEAIQGLSHLAFHISSDPALTDAFGSFAGSPDPAERFLVAWYLLHLHRHWSDHFWSIAANRAAAETNPAIVARLIRTIWEGTGPEEKQGLTILRDLLPRWLDTESSSLRQAVADSLVMLTLVRDLDWGWTLVHEIEKDPVRRHELLDDIVSSAAQLLVRTDRNTLGPEVDKRAVDWFVTLLAELKEEAQSTRRRLEAEKTDASAAEAFRTLHSLVAEVVRRMYFGARSDGPGRHKKGSAEPQSRIHEYVELVRPIMRATLSFADDSGAGVLIPSAAHEFMQLLKIALPFGPDEALSMAAATARSASATGYQFDSLAVKEVISLVEVVLADYRHRLVEGTPLSDTLVLLDVFADAGWPEALNLVWRLDEVFR